MTYNTRNPAVKRILREAAELSESTELYYAQPLEENLFEWHFTIRGPADTEFDGGFYHGRILLPTDYPMKPPNVIFLTPNGRFELHKKICLSISGYHPETWRPCWSIRTALLAIIGFMPSHGQGAIGSLYYPTEERKKLAKKSLEYKCPSCGDLSNLLKPVTEASKSDVEEAKKLATELQFTEGKTSGTGEDNQKISESSVSQSSSSGELGATAAAATAASNWQVQPPIGQDYLARFNWTSNNMGSINMAPPLGFTEWLQQVKGLSDADATAAPVSAPAVVPETPRDTETEPAIRQRVGPLLPPAVEATPVARDLPPQVPTPSVAAATDWLQEDVQEEQGVQSKWMLVAMLLLVVLICVLLWRRIIRRVSDVDSTLGSTTDL